MSGYKGIVGTPVTPFDAQGGMDEPALRKLIGFLLDSGIDGLAVPMHIGESLNLSTEERKTLAGIALETVDGQVPVLVNVSTPGTDTATELAVHAQEAGASGIVLLSPYFWQLTPEVVVEHFRRVGSAVDIDILAYNFPEKIGISLEGELLDTLLEQVPNLVGIKDASFRMDYFTEVCRVGTAARESFAAFTGVEYLLPGMAVGGVGAFSAMGAIAPRLVRELYEACLKGDEAAKELQYRLGRIWRRVQTGYPASIKTAMAIMGRDVGITRGPVLPFDDEQTEILRRELSALGVLDGEPHGWKARDN